jgi:serine/threonine-protein kinase RsbW
MTSKTPAKHCVLVESLPAACENVYKKMLAELETKSFSRDDIFAIHLAVEEAFINAALHGNDFDSDKKIKIEYSIAGDKIEVWVTDQGDGFDVSLIPDPRDEENRLKSHGRGLLLMRSYMDVVDFNKKGNCVHMVKNKSEADCSKQ